MSHRNAPVSEIGRLRLARCAVEDGLPLCRAAERLQVSVTTARAGLLVDLEYWLYDAIGLRVQDKDLVQDQDREN